MTQQQLREPVPGPHQITAGVLTSADQIARGLLLRPGHPHRGDLAQPQQPRQPLGVPPVGLDPVGRRPDLRRRRDNAADPRLGTRTRKPVPGRPRLVHDPDRRRQRLQPRHRRIRPRRHPQRPHLTAPHIDHARDHRPSVHIKPDTATFVHNRRLLVIAALPPRLSRRQPAPTYERGAGHSIRSGAGDRDLSTNQRGGTNAYTARR